MSDRLGVTEGAIGWIAALSLDDVGDAIAGVFVLTWMLSVAVWRVGRIEDRWTIEPSA